MRQTSKSAVLFERNRRVIPGGVMSLNRLVRPEIAFERGRGSRVWDVDGNEYIDDHAGFAPYLLGHKDPDVNAAVRRALDGELTLMGSGTTPWEERLAGLTVRHVPLMEAVQLTNTGSEATFHALRIARAHTGRDGVVLMQGGCNAPVDRHDIAAHHDADRDLRYRRALIERGTYQFPQPPKQGSLSFAHTEEDLALALERTREVTAALGSGG